MIEVSGLETRSLRDCPFDLAALVELERYRHALSPDARGDLDYALVEPAPFEVPVGGDRMGAHPISARYR